MRKDIKGCFDNAGMRGRIHDGTVASEREEQIGFSKNIKADDNYG